MAKPFVTEAGEYQVALNRGIQLIPLVGCVESILPTLNKLLEADKFKC